MEKAVKERFRAAMPHAPALAPQPDVNADPAPPEFDAGNRLSTDEKAHRAKIYVNHARELQLGWVPSFPGLAWLISVATYQLR